MTVLAFQARTKSDVDALEDEVLVHGYRSGLVGKVPTDEQRSDRAFMHGFRCGSNDRAGIVEPWQRELAKEVAPEMMRQLLRLNSRPGLQHE